MELLASGRGIGYLLKSRVADITEFVDTLERIAATYTPWPAASAKSRILLPDRAVFGRNPTAGVAAISSA